MVRCAPLLASISRSRIVGRRSTGAAVTLALALSLPLGGIATAVHAAAPKDAPPPPPPAAKASAADAKAPAADAKEPAKLEVLLPLTVEGSLSKDSRRTLAKRLETAAAGVKATGGPYRVRLSVRVTKKKDYALALTVLAPDDATITAPTEECKGCSLDQVGAKIDALVQQAAGSLAPKESPPATAASVSVRSEPLGARVLVDGTERGFTPLELELPPGEHTIALDKPGFVAQEQTLTVEAGAAQELSPTLVAQPAADKKGKRAAKADKADKSGPADPKAGRGLKIGGGVMLGLGLAGVAAGVAMILVDEDPMPLKCSDAEVDFRGVCRYRYDTLLGGIVGTAAGGLGVAGGLAMMIQGHRISVRARASKQEASLGLIVRF
jgi:hypothetical protein